MSVFVAKMFPWGTDGKPDYVVDTAYNTGHTSTDGDEIILPTWVWDGVPTRRLVEELAKRAGCLVVVDEADDQG